MNLNLPRTLFYGLQVNLTLKAQRSMATDSIFILLLPGMGSKTEAPCDKIIAGGEKLSLGEPHSMSGNLRRFFFLFFFFLNILLFCVCVYISKYINEGRQYCFGPQNLVIAVLKMGWR